MPKLSSCNPQLTLPKTNVVNLLFTLKFIKQKWNMNIPGAEY